MGLCIRNRAVAWRHGLGNWFHREVYLMTKTRTHSSAAPVEPYAWVIPGDDQSRPSGSIDAMAWREGEFTKPLYAQMPAAPVETWLKDPQVKEALHRRPHQSCSAERSAEIAIAALAKRFWSTHPSTLDDMGLTREEFYASEMVKLFGALTRNEPQELPDREAIEAILQDEVFCRRDGTYSYGNAATRILAACSVSQSSADSEAFSAALEQLAATARTAIRYVGHANDSTREREALSWIRKKHEGLLASVLPRPQSNTGEAS